MKSPFAKILFLILLIMAGITAGVVYYFYSKIPPPEVPFTKVEPVVVKEYGLPVDSFKITHGKIKAGMNISTILSMFKIAPGVIDKVVNSSDSIFDLRRVKAGNAYAAFCSKDSTHALHYLVYEHSPAEYIVFNFKDTLVTREEKQVLTKEFHASATIESSLWGAIEDNNLNVGIAVMLADIYAWSIDFFELSKGDRFKVIYDEQFVDSTSLGVSSIKAACFEHNGKNYYAIPFTQDTTPEFFDENGNSLRKAFLKAPLKFCKVVSGFSNARLHPILKIYRPHHGVDYAAPVGTPVYSIGKGKVIQMGYFGDSGNMVKIDHGNGYSTISMHLSGFPKGLKTGSHISQGDVVGYVGSTGLSTGPHLDFRVYKNGKAINPLKMDSPPAEPVKKAYKKTFETVKIKLVKQLDRIKF